MRRAVMNLSAKTRIALWSFFIFVGVIVAAIGLLFLIGSGADKKRCNEPVTAVVVDNARVPSIKAAGQFNYAPVLEYEYRGQTYRHRSRISTNPPRFQIGQRVELMIDPDNPSTVYEKNSEKSITGVIIMGASAIFLFLGIFGVSLNVKRMKQYKGGQLPPSHSNWN